MRRQLEDGVKDLKRDGGKLEERNKNDPARTGKAGKCLDGPATAAALRRAWYTPPSNRLPNRAAVSSNFFQVALLKGVGP